MQNFVTVDVLLKLLQLQAAKFRPRVQRAPHSKLFPLWSRFRDCCAERTSKDHPRRVVSVI